MKVYVEKDEWYSFWRLGRERQYPYEGEVELSPKVIAEFERCVKYIEQVQKLIKLRVEYPENTDA